MSQPPPNEPMKVPSSPAKFIKPADLFKARRRSHLEPQSPLKSLNLLEASPVKKLPQLLKNPFSQPVKRKLDLGKQQTKTGNGNEGSQGNKSNNINTICRGELELDEDANIEAPRIKRPCVEIKTCYENNWTLRTRLRINFEKQCRNWDSSSISTHKRRTRTWIEESPCKVNDKTISLEAIKNFSTVYQHPYLSWMPLYPRITLEFSDKKNHPPFSLTKHSEISNMMHKDWCESLDDLTNLLIGGRCPYFYLCADNYNILFKQAPLPQVYISPLSCGMGCELNKGDVKFNCIDPSWSNSNSNRPSVDSGNASCDLEEEEDEDFVEDDENDDASQILESLGLSQQDFPSLSGKKRAFVETDSNTQTKSTSNKPLAFIEGVDNLRNLVEFLKTNRMYTISAVGKFACIPPTLLSPREFRFSTPQYPDVTLSKGTKSGPTFIELNGTILPSLYVELHKLLTISDNLNHTCQSTQLESSQPFGSVQFTL